MLDAIALATQCAPQVHPITMAAVLRVESSENPYAIGVVGGRLIRQPRNKQEAVATAKALEQAGWNFSVGSSQVNRYNLAKFGLTYETAFEPCANVGAGAAILKDCYDRAEKQFDREQHALEAALSCYYSGNFRAGLKPDFKGQPSYVEKVLAQARNVDNVIPVVPAPRSMPPRPKAPTAQPVLNEAKDEQEQREHVKASRKSHPSVPPEYDGFSPAKNDKSSVYDGFAAGDD
jgi:type IV secretion system protein VirB1